MKYNIILILLTVLLISIILKKYMKEDFVAYQSNPNTIYQKWRTGSQPLSFYNYPIYRKPYRNGFVFDQSYPFPYKNSLGFELSSP